MDTLQIKRLGLEFKNPIIVAATDIGRSLDSLEAFAEAGVGGIVTKSVTDAAALQKASISRMHITDMAERPVRSEIPEHYYFFSRGGSMISMEEYEPKAVKMIEIAKKYQTVLIGSISASKTENWVDYAKRFEALGFPALELNFGNPHGEAADGKLGFLIGQSEALCTEIASKVVGAVNIPVIVKLTPQVSDMAGLCKALEAVGVQAVTVMHRYQGLMIDENTDMPILGGWAAIGGPWMKPLSLANITKVRRQTGLTILGGNGADTVRDVYDYMLAGADLVEIGSSMLLRGPDYAKKLVERLGDYLKEKHISSVSEIVGACAAAITTYKNLGELPARKSRLDLRKCDRCADKPCVSKCYFGALTVKDGLLSHDDALCSGCGLCEYICPADAVRME